MKNFLRAGRRFFVILAGSVVLLVGLAMIVLPGPAVIVIPLGLAILSTEVPIARRWYRRGRVWIGRKIPAVKRFAKRVRARFIRRRHFRA